MTDYSSSSRFWEGVQADPAIKDAWGTPNSNNMTLVDSAINGTSTIDLTGLSTYTLSVANGASDEAREQLLNFVNTPAANCTVTLPNVNKIGWAVNNTTGGFSVILTSGAGTTATVPNDGFWHLYSCDGNGNVVLPITGGGVTPGGGAVITGTSLSISGNGSISGTLAANAFNAVTANITGLATIQGGAFGTLGASQASFATLSAQQVTVSGLLTANGLNVTGPFSAGSFNPQSISTGALTAASANIQGTLSAGTFNPANISTGNIQANSATISGTLSAGTFSPSSVSTGALAATSANISGTLTAGSFNPSSITTGTINATNIGATGTFSAASVIGTTVTSNGSLFAGTAHTLQVNLSVASAFAGFSNSSVTVGSITPNGGSGVLYNTTSDERLKMFHGEIEPEQSGKIIDRLEAVWFRWKKNPLADPEPGFFAQRVHRIFRWAVTPGVGKPGDADFKPWQMDPAKLMPVAIAEIKHLRARAEKLEQRLAMLKPLSVVEMPFRTLKLQPGVNLEQSPTLNSIQLAASNLVRFYGGLVQQLGGWAQMTAQLFVGVCRGLHGWSDITGNNYLAVGTNQRLQILQNGTIQDITPVTATTNPGVDFSTVALSPLVKITDAGATPSVGDWVFLATPVSVDVLILFGFYQVQSVVDGTHYTVKAASAAVNTVADGGVVPEYTTVNSQSLVTVTLPNHGLQAGGIYNAAVSTTVATIVIAGLYSVTARIDANNFTITTTGTANAGTSAFMNSGNAQIEYLLPTGFAQATAVTGYGIGGYGLGDYGVGEVAQTIVEPGRQWSLDHWGQDLIASPSYGKIYFWQPPTPSPAVVLSVTAPLYNISIFVMPQAQIIISLGAEISGILQPLLIRWCDAGDFTDWDATAINQAGSYLIPTGSILVGGLAAGLGAMFWTDKDVWSVTYLGFPLVFGFNRIATECGLIAQRARGIIGTFVMWLGYQQFFQAAVGGGVTPMECPVFDFYWNNVDQAQFQQIFCAVNAVFNEMAWHFPIVSTSPLYNPLAPLGYVKYNYVEQVWDYGLSPQYQRTAWEGKSPVGNPVGADLAGLLQQHEEGYNANGSAMLWSWQSGYFTLSEGKDFVFSDFLIPDFVTIGNPTFVPNLLTLDYPSGQTPTQVSTPQIAWGTTRFITYAARGRYMSIGFAASPADIASFFRLGGIRVRVAPDGEA